jgi:hypothetical protein
MPSSLNDTRILIKEVFLHLGATYTLLMFKDIVRIGYHLTTACNDGVEYLHITALDGRETKVIENPLDTSFGLYHSRIKPPHKIFMMSTIFRNHESFLLWHQRIIP